MGEWKDIESAPKDGSKVWVKRMSPTGKLYNKTGVVAEGWAVFDVPDARAPMLSPLGPDPLGRPVDYAGELRGIEEARVTRRWLKPDRMYAFPTPTHWLPTPSGQE